MHQVTQRPVVALVELRPTLPRRLGALETAANLPGRPRRWLRPPRVELGERELPLLPYVQDLCDRRAGPTEVEVHIGAQHHDCRAAVRDDRAGRGDQAGVHQAELGTRDELHPHPHRPPGTANLPQQHPRGRAPQLVSTLAMPQGHRVDHDELTVRTRPRRLQHQPGQPVPPRRRPRAVDWGDQEMACGVVEKTAQHRRRVETGQAQPVHRTGGGHQRRRAAVRQQGMCGQRHVAHRGSGLTAASRVPGPAPPRRSPRSRHPVRLRRT